MRLTISLVLCATLLSGCSLWRKKNTVPPPPPEPVVVTEYIVFDCGTPPQRDSIDLRIISEGWKILNGRFTLSAQGYEDLSFNVTQIWKGVKQLTSEIMYYENCLERAKAAVSKEDQ